MSGPAKRRPFRRFFLWLLIAVLIVAASAFATNRLLTLLNGSGDTPWNLTLVNADNALPRGWSCSLTELRNGESVDSRMYPYLQAMFDAARADGLVPIVLSGYRTEEQQQQEYDAKVAALEAQGYAASEAKALAEKAAALPGRSEHQLGLAVDIDSEDTSVCTDQQVWDWMAEHCAEYGFILRYPQGKEDVTGYDYEPWHFRYVGAQAAEKIMRQSITLEEY